MLAGPGPRDRSVPAASRLALAVAALVTGGAACVGGDDPGDGVDGGVDGAAGPTRYPVGALVSPVTPAVAARLRAIADANPFQHGDVFIKVGDSHTVNPALLTCLAGPERQPGYAIDLDGRTWLEPVLDHFRAGRVGPDTPFERVSAAAAVGRTARWAITGAPSPLDQELAAAAPRFALVNYGTNDMEQGTTYASAMPGFLDTMTELLDQLEAAGVVPIVAGLTPRTDLPDAARWVPTYEAVTRALAEARQVPYVDLYRAMVDLPGQGLSGDGVHGDTYVTGGRAEPCILTAAGLDHTYNQRNLLAADSLDRAWRALDGEPPDAPPLPPVAGAGTDDDPFVIDTVPFTHSWDTRGGQRQRAAYPACDDGQDESGPEIVYRLELTAPTPVRVIAIDRAGVDVDVHLLEAGACVERADRLLDRTVPAGDHRIVVDSFVAGGVERAGSYSLVVVACQPDDPDCGP